MKVVQLKGNKVVQNFVMDMPFDIRVPYKNDFQMPGNLIDDSIVLATLQLPVTNHLFLDQSSDDINYVGDDRE